MSNTLLKLNDVFNQMNSTILGKKFINIYASGGNCLYFNSIESKDCSASVLIDRDEEERLFQFLLSRRSS